LQSGGSKSTATASLPLQSQHDLVEPTIQSRSTLPPNILTSSIESGASGGKANVDSKQLLLDQIKSRSEKKEQVDPKSMLLAHIKSRASSHDDSLASSKLTSPSAISANINVQVDNNTKSMLMAQIKSRGSNIEQSAQSKPLTTLSPTEATTDGSTNDPELARYMKMKSVGIPSAAILHKMEMDKVDASKIKLFRAQLDKQSARAAAADNSTIEQTPIISPKRQSRDKLKQMLSQDEDCKKYLRAVSVGVPAEAVAHKMKSKIQNVNKSNEYDTLYPQMDDKSLDYSDDEKVEPDPLLDQLVGAKSSSPSRKENDNKPNLSQQMKYGKGVRVINVAESNKKGVIVGTDGEYAVEYTDGTTGYYSEDAFDINHEFDDEEGSDASSEMGSKSKEELTSSDDDKLSVNSVDKEEGAYKTSDASLFLQEKRGVTGEDNGKKAEETALVDIPVKKQQAAAAVAGKKAEADKMEMDVSPTKKDMGSSKMEVSPEKKGNGANVGSTPAKKKESKHSKGKGTPGKKGGNGGGKGGGSKGSSKGKGNKKSTGGRTRTGPIPASLGNNNEVGFFNHSKIKSIVKKIEREKTKVVASIKQLDEVKKKDKASARVKAGFAKMQIDMVRDNDKCMSDELKKKVYEPWEKACKELLDEMRLVRYAGEELDWNKFSVNEVRKLGDLFNL